MALSGLAVRCREPCHSSSTMRSAAPVQRCSRQHAALPEIAATGNLLTFHIPAQNDKCARQVKGSCPTIAAITSRPAAGLRFRYQTVA